MVLKTGYPVVFIQRKTGMRHAFVNCPIMTYNCPYLSYPFFLSFMISRPIQIVFLLFPKTHLLDLAGPAQVFYEANNLGNMQFRLHFVSVAGSVRSEQGLLFARLSRMEDLKLQKGDMICVPGIDFASFSKGEMDTSVQKAKNWLRQQYKQGIYLASICSGSLLLAEMGLLDGVKCTTHWKCIPYAKAEYPRARFVDKRLYIFDKGIFTSAGMTSGIDMALALVEKWINPLLAARVAQEMVINIRRSETSDQKNIFLDFKNHFNADVYKAQEILAGHPEPSYTIKDLAKELNLSARQLARLFKSHTKQTIQAYREKLRLDHGLQLLRHTELSVKEIALRCGYESARQFTRLWKKRTGETPVETRKNK
ncbi:MAG: ftrA [Bacteroidetes bacterium]|nr:MAG: ftrA [Bacteroidota bacterium]